MKPQRLYPPLPPITCRYCQGEVRLVENQEIYGKNYGKYPYSYWCEKCGSYVGIHPGSDLPLGTLADHNLREWRKRSKKAFIDYYQSKHWKRETAYQWLQQKLCLLPDDCHFGLFEIEDCINVLEVLKNCKEVK